MNLLKSGWLGVGLVTLMLMVPLGAGATPYTWDAGGGTNAWGTKANWNPENNNKPDGVNDTATINIGNYNPVQLSTTITLGGSTDSLIIGTSAGATALNISGTLQMRGGISNAKIITLPGTLVNDATTATTHYSIHGDGGSISMSGGLISSKSGGIWDFNQAVSGYGTISAPVDNYSTITANSATALGITGALTNKSGGILNAGTSTTNTTGTLAFSGSGSLSNSGTVNVYGTLSNTGSALALTGSGNAYLYGGTLSGAGGFSNANNLKGYGTILAGLANAGTLTASGAGKTLTVSGGVLGSGNVKVGTAFPTITDTVTMSLGSNLAAKDFTLYDKATLNQTAGTILLTGNFNNYAATSTTQWQPTTGLNLSMGSSTSTFSTFEVAGKDSGALAAGFSGNFNLALLTVTGNLELLDSVDNGFKALSSHNNNHEALYITSLTGIGALDLNNLWVYVKEGSIIVPLSNGLYNYGGSTIQISESPYVVPIPGSVLLLGSGLVGLGLLRFRRREKKS